MIDEYNLSETDNKRSRILKKILTSYYDKKDLFLNSINILPKSYDNILLKLGLNKKINIELSTKNKKH